MLNLRLKITLLTSTIILAALSFMAYSSYHFLMKISLEESLKTLEAVTDGFRRTASDTFSHIEDDIYVLSRTPPFTGLIRSIQNKGTDPLDGSTTQLWRERLNTIFESFLMNRNYYTQIRFIGLINFGKEIVRVDRRLNGIKVTSVSELQEKQQEPYFQSALYLKPNELAYSNVSYNREHGKIDSNKTPTIRCIYPIFNNHKLFGMLIINIDYNKLMQEIILKYNPQYETLIINNALDYIHYKPGEKFSPVEMHSNYTRPLPEVIESNRSKLLVSGKYESKKYIAIAKQLEIDPKNYNSKLHLLLIQPTETISLHALQISYYNLIYMFIIILLSTITSLFASNYLVRPLTQMSKSLRLAKESNDDSHIFLPIERNDEIGDLARSFALLTEKINKEKESVQKIINGTSDSIIVFHENGHIQFFNHSSLLLFGYNAEEMHVKKIDSILPNMLEHLHRENIFNEIRETTATHKKGYDIDVEYCINIIFSEGHSNFICILRDIAERKKIDTIKSEFITIVNHELRTPLTAIHGALGVIKQIAKNQLPEKIKELIDISYNNSTRLGLLVDDILDVQKLASGKMNYKVETIEVNELIKHITSQNKGYADKHNVQYKLELTHQPLYCNIDKNRFTQALTNLLSNATKFSKPQSTVTTKTKLLNNGWVQIMVIDHGKGIPNHFKHKLFQKFAQNVADESKETKGTGLGLFITKSFVEALGGKISFESEEGIGTTFFIQFKQAK